MPSRLHLIASYLLLAMACTTLAHWLFLPQLPLWLSGAFAWLALALLMASSPRGLFRQFFLLAVAGSIFLAWGGWRGADISLLKLLSQNNSIVVMLYCVGYLRLVARAAEESEPLPVGRMAFVHTLLGVHLLGSVINASILVLVAEHLKSHQALGKQALVAAARGFAAATFWSPFFAALGVALTYAPGAALLPVLGIGVILALLGLAITVLEQGGKGLHRLDDFRGYPTHLSNLAIPLLLAGLVILLHRFFPDLPVLTLVSVTALLLSSMYLFWRDRGAAPVKLKRHVDSSSQRLTRELALFMGAAILTVGLQALFSTVDNLLPFSHIGGMELSLLLGLSVVLSILGVHPVVTISIMGPTVMPFLPQPDLLAILFLAIWGIGIAINPYSGVNTILRSHADVSSAQLVRWNLRYSLLVWLLVSAVFLLH